MYDYFIIKHEKVSISLSVREHKIYYMYDNYQTTKKTLKREIEEGREKIIQTVFTSETNHKHGTQGITYQ